MEINRRVFLRKVNWALAGVIGMLGFSGCNKSAMLVEYGSPYADYTVKGTVVN